MKNILFVLGIIIAFSFVISFILFALSIVLFLFTTAIKIAIFLTIAYFIYRLFKKIR